MLPAPAARGQTSWLPWSVLWPRDTLGATEPGPPGSSVLTAKASRTVGGTLDSDGHQNAGLPPPGNGTQLEPG